MQNADEEFSAEGSEMLLHLHSAGNLFKTIGGEKGMIEYSVSSGFTAFEWQGAYMQRRQAKQADRSTEIKFNKKISPVSTAGTCKYLHRF